MSATLQPLTVRRLTSDADLSAAYPLMAELRPHLSADTFVDDVRQQERDGYALLGGFAADDRLVALAGIRPARTLWRGPHLFVDDLVTTAAEQGRGYGTALLRHVAGHARSLGLPQVWLDSRATALGFYQQFGFAPTTAVPCRVEVDGLPGQNTAQKETL